jgi:hypothetical protein
MYNNQYLIDIVDMLVDDIQTSIPFWGKGLKRYNKLPRATLYGTNGINLHIWIDIKWEHFIIKIDTVDDEIIHKIGYSSERLCKKLQRIAEKLWIKMKNKKPHLRVVK